MYILDQCGRELDDGTQTNITIVRSLFATERPSLVFGLLIVQNSPVNRYGLRKLPKKRGVRNIDDIYHILFYHQVYDDNMYRDEQQRHIYGFVIWLQTVSMFDARIQSLEDSATRMSVDGLTVAGTTRSWVRSCKGHD